SSSTSGLHSGPACPFGASRSPLPAGSVPKRKRSHQGEVSQSLPFAFPGRGFLSATARRTFPFPSSLSCVILQDTGTRCLPAAELGLLTFLDLRGSLMRFFPCLVLLPFLLGCAPAGG